ncbi:MAG: methyltransferase domain-containing protein [Bacteroidota bacterium]
MNYFDFSSVAERYAKGRPYFHPNTIDHIQQTLEIAGKLDKILDVACGTGLSSKALLAIGHQVIGTDISEEMLAYARQEIDIEFLQSPAETLPFTDGEFDLITVSSGVHWFDIDAFLTECHRLLKPYAFLVLYENYFLAEMEGDDTFQSWVRQSYLGRFPSPPRNRNYDWQDENLGRFGLRQMQEERFKNSISFTPDQLILYFTTQSNITAALQDGKTSYSEVEAWLEQELSVFFPTRESVRHISYGNWVKYIQKVSDR